MQFNLGLFLVVTGVAFLAGTALRLLYVLYLRSRSERDVRNVMKNLRFRDVEALESSSSDDDDVDGRVGYYNDFVEMNRVSATSRAELEAEAEAGETRSERDRKRDEMLLPPLRDRENRSGAPPAHLAAETTTTEGRGRGGKHDRQRSQTKTRKSGGEGASSSGRTKGKSGKPESEKHAHADVDNDDNDKENAGGGDNVP